MTPDATSLAKLIGQLDVNDAAKQERSSHERLGDALAELRHAENTIAQAGKVQDIIRGTQSTTLQNQTELFSLMYDCDKLARIASTVSETILETVVDAIPSLGRADKTQKDILAHFRDQVKDIVHTAMDDAGNQCTLWMIVEKCYRESIDHNGSLHSESYYIPIGETTLQWPYDPDSESEAYYDHVDRLGDESYGQPFRIEYERMQEAKSKRNDEWVGFWVRALQACPNGPTLFYPPATQVAIGPDGLCCPSKLIRIFDGSSPGFNNKHVFASVKAQAQTAQSRVDLLGLDRVRARKMLHEHLNKGFVLRAIRSDDLISWTSSLLFGIQYAIYRCHEFDLSYDDVNICVVDPRQFPHGQFIRDKRLIEIYREFGNTKDGYDRFFDFRMNWPEYDNGEYLSQGRVSIRNRSCVVTLAQLDRSNLFKLYPEFTQEYGENKWAKRVLQLRSLWSTPQRTTMTEIRIALRLAKQCFPPFDAVNTALMFLTLKNRKLKRSSHSEQLESDLRQVVRAVFSANSEPAEVERYHDLLRKVEIVREENSGLLTEEGILSRVFECDDE